MRTFFKGKTAAKELSGGFYPEKKWVVAEGYRGAPYLVKDPAGNTKCVSCQLCEFVCPPKAIKIMPPGPVMSNADRPNAEKMPAEFEINMLRCIFCGYCQEVCPEEAIFLQKDYSLTGTEPQRNDLQQGEAARSRWRAPQPNREVETKSEEAKAQGIAP